MFQEDPFYVMRLQKELEANLWAFFKDINEEKMTTILFQVFIKGTFFTLNFLLCYFDILRIK